MLSKVTSVKNSEQLLLNYCKNIDDWPNQWEIDQSDVKMGQAINKYFKLFLLDKIDNGISKKTIKIYANYLWVLGGELIRQINDDDDERSLSAKDLILKYVDDGGGPYWRHAVNENDHAKYDSVCKQLFKFITENIH
jgi:hypothetical protein